MFNELSSTKFQQLSVAASIYKVSGSTDLYIDYNTVRNNNIQLLFIVKNT